MANTIREFGHEAHVRLRTDAAAPSGFALRSGSGAIEHVEARYFWLQQKEMNKEFKLEDPRYSQFRRLDETSGWKTCDDVVRFVEHQTHRRSTEFSSEADIGL